MTGWNEFDAAAHVLRDPLIERRTKGYIRYSPPAIAFDEILDVSRGWSHGERLLVLASLDLWNGRAVEVDDTYCLRRLVDTLTRDHVERVIEGVRILAGSTR